MSGMRGDQPREVNQNNAEHILGFDPLRQGFRQKEQEKQKKLHRSQNVDDSSSTSQTKEACISTALSRFMALGLMVRCGIDKSERTSITSGESSHASGSSVNEAGTPTATNGSRDEHHPPHGENRDAANGSGDDRTSTPSTDQPKHPTPEKRLEWLALTKVTKILENRGLFKHLGYGTTDITIQGIEAKNFQVYTTKDGDEITYYITDKDMASLEAKYSIKNFNKVKLDKVIDDLEQEKNFDKIQWDLPKIHAIRTVEKNPVDEHRTEGKFQENVVRPRENPEKMPRVLITDSEDIVRKRMVNPRTESEKRGWKAALPWASLGFDISGKKITDEEKLIYKALHRKLSDKTRTKYKQIYENNEKLLKNIIDSNEKYKNDIINHENNIVNLYYKSDSFTKKKLEEEFSNYGDRIQAVKKELKEESKENTIKEKIADYLGKVFTNFESIWKPRGIAYKAISHQLSGLGFDQLGDGSKTKFDMRGDLYVVDEGNDSIRFTNKRPDDDSALVDVKQLEVAEKELEKEPDKVKWDLKVYVIQRPDQTSAEGDSKDKKPEILVTDDRDLVARMRKQGWKALPWTEAGIELSEEDKQFYQNYRKFYQNCDENIRQRLDRCHNGMNKIYWDCSGEYKRKEMAEKIKELKIDLKDYIIYAEEKEEKILSQKIKKNIEDLDMLVEDVIEEDYLKKHNIFPVLKEKLQAELKEHFSDFEIVTHVDNITSVPLKVFEHGGSLYLSYANEVKFQDESGKEVSFTKKCFADYSNEDLAREKVQWRFVTTSLLLRPKKEGNQDGPEKPVLWVTNINREAGIKQREGWMLLGCVENIDIKWGDIEGGSERMVSSFKGFLEEWYKKSGALNGMKNKLSKNMD